MTSIDETGSDIDNGGDTDNSGDGSATETADDGRPEQQVAPGGGKQ